MPAGRSAVRTGSSKENSPEAASQHAGRQEAVVHSPLATLGTSPVSSCGGDGDDETQKPIGWRREVRSQSLLSLQEEQQTEQRRERRDYRRQVFLPDKKEDHHHGQKDEQQLAHHDPKRHGDRHHEQHRDPEKSYFERYCEQLSQQHPFGEHYAGQSDLQEQANSDVAHPADQSEPLPNFSTPPPQSSTPKSPPRDRSKSVRAQMMKAKPSVGGDEGPTCDKTAANHAEERGEGSRSSVSVFSRLGSPAKTEGSGGESERGEKRAPGLHLKSFVIHNSSKVLVAAPAGHFVDRDIREVKLCAL